MLLMNPPDPPPPPALILVPVSAMPSRVLVPMSDMAVTSPLDCSFIVAKMDAKLVVVVMIAMLYLYVFPLFSPQIAANLGTAKSPRDDECIGIIV